MCVCTREQVVEVEAEGDSDARARTGVVGVRICQVFVAASRCAVLRSLVGSEGAFGLLWGEEVG